MEQLWIWINWLNYHISKILSMWHLLWITQDPNRYLIDIHEDKLYTKLYNACPYLKNIPLHNGTIVAGGFINLALDDTLKYEDYPTSDIDIFVPALERIDNIFTVSNKYKMEVQKLIEYFNTYHATFTRFGDIINVSIPEYKRNFQIMCVYRDNPYNILKHFHSDHLKCGFRSFSLDPTSHILFMFPECKNSIETRIVRINRNNINSYTLTKILKRGYIVENMRPYSIDELETFPVCMTKQDIIKKSRYIELEPIKNNIGICNFNVYYGHQDLPFENKIGYVRFGNGKSKKRYYNIWLYIGWYARESFWKEQIQIISIIVLQNISYEWSPRLQFWLRILYMYRKYYWNVKVRIWTAIDVFGCYVNCKNVKL